MNLQDKFENILFRFDICRDEVSESKERLQIVSDEYAVEFALYLSDNYISRTLGTWDDGAGTRFTSEEVLIIFKKEKGL